MQLNNVALVGVNYRSAPIEVRERMAFGKSPFSSLQQLCSQDLIKEAVLLSTCNRTEVLVSFDLEREEDHRFQKPLKSVKRFFEHKSGLAGDDLERYLYTFIGKDAVSHLLRVAAGLDSMVVGEDQILGQVREAHKLAAQAGTTGTVLDFLMRQALRVGKRVRTETGISSSCRSVGSAAVELALKTLGTLQDKTILTVGAGDISELVVRELSRVGVKAIIMANRTYQHACQLAEKYSARAVPLSQLNEMLPGADIVISSTAAPHYIITKDHVKEAQQRRTTTAPILLIDLAVPRDIQPSAAELENVVLFNIDDLTRLSKEELKSVLTEAEAIIREELDKVHQWVKSRQAAPTIVALRRHFEQIRQEELKSAFSKMPHLNETERKMVDELTRSLMNKLLHGPTIALKQRVVGLDTEQCCRIISDIFNLDLRE